MKEAARKAGIVFLEPIMKVEVRAPEDYFGAVVGDINSRRGKVLGMEAQNKFQVIRVQVPMAEMLDYDHTLKSITRGQGSFTMQLAQYEQVPAYLSEKIIAAASAGKEEQ